VWLVNVNDLPFVGKERHKCWRWCGQRLIGIVENQRTVGRWEEGKDVAVSCRRPSRRLGPNDLRVTCQHQRVYWLIPNDAFNGVEDEKGEQ
jgi:hypothetical protein